MGNKARKTNRIVWRRFWLFMILEDGLKLPTMLTGSLVECGLKPMIILMVLKQVIFRNFVDYETIMTVGQASGENNNVGSGWIYTYPSPLTKGGWLDTYYLMMVPTNEIVLNPKAYAESRI